MGGPEFATSRIPGRGRFTGAHLALKNTHQRQSERTFCAQKRYKKQQTSTNDFKHLLQVHGLVCRESRKPRRGHRPRRPFLVRGHPQGPRAQGGYTTPLDRNESLKINRPLRNCQDKFLRPRIKFMD